MFHETWAVSCLAGQLLVSFEGVYCILCFALIMQYALTFVIGCCCLLHSGTLAGAVGPVFLLLLFYTY